MPAPGCYHVVSELYRRHFSAWERQKPQTGLITTQLPPCQTAESKSQETTAGPWVLPQRALQPRSPLQIAGGLRDRAVGCCVGYTGRLRQQLALESESVTQLLRDLPVCHPASPSPTSPKGHPLSGELSYTSGSQYPLEPSRKGARYLERRTDEGQVPTKLCDLRQVA